MALSSITLFISLISTLLPLSFVHSTSISSSNSIASDQLKFWSENVDTQMPKSILEKLSPLSSKDSDYYTNMLYTNGDKFYASSSAFCSVAKLACSSELENVKKAVTYASARIYMQEENAFPFENERKNADPFSFFRVSSLKSGTLIHLPNLQGSFPDRSFLPSRLASGIPLTYDAVLKILPELESMKKTKEAVQSTLYYCNAEAIEGETKICAKSVEEMVGFAKTALGTKKVVALTSNNMGGSSEEVMVGRIKTYSEKNVAVACHELFLPFATYFCHSIASSRLYSVEIVDVKMKVPINTMVAICHMDTSAWPANHVAFDMLKFGPGEGEACHWFSHLDIAWIGSGI